VADALAECLENPLVNDGSYGGMTFFTANQRSAATPWVRALLCDLDNADPIPSLESFHMSRLLLSVTTGYRPIP
jgi:hypothetical protein